MATAVAAAVGVALTVAAPVAEAHPLGNFTTNRSSAIVVSTTRITVRYLVDMAEIPTFQERSRIDGDGDGEVADAELSAYANRMGRSLIEGVRLTSDGADVELSLGGCRAELRPGQGGLQVLRIVATFSGALPSERAAIAYEDRNFTDPERLGWKEVTARAVGGQGIHSSSVPSLSPSDGLRRYPKDLLASPPEVTRAHLIVGPEADGVAPEDGSVPGTGRSGEFGSFAALIEQPLSPLYFVTALLLALGFGAMHALGPGHGKTVMAAYLVGAQGRVQDALLLGVAVSLMHTASVVALGLATLAASNMFAPETVYPWLSLAAGVLVLGLGCWLLWTRLGLALNLSPGQNHHSRGHSHLHVYPHKAGRAHTKMPGHSHPQGAGAADDTPRAGRALIRGTRDHPVEPRQARDHRHRHSRGGGATRLPARPGLGAVALSGGLLPSPTALVVLLGAVALDRIAFGVVLVGAFSVGLAAALTAVGIVVLRARDFASGRLGHRTGDLLPVLSAAAIVAVGLFLTARAVSNLP